MIISKINLQALSKNYKDLSAIHKVGAVVKSDAYGLGLKETAKTLQDLGCNVFYVGAPEEAIYLRQLLGDKVEILCLNGFFIRLSQEYIDKKIIPVLISEQQLEQVLNYDIEFFIHFDTGLNRTGIPYDKSKEYKNLSKLRGVISHLSQSYLTQVTELTETQLKRTEELFSQFSCKKSLLKTAAIPFGLEEKAYLYDEIRPGHGLFFKVDQVTNHDVARFSSRVIQHKYVKKGEPIGYGANFIAEKDMLIGIVDCGYGQGLNPKHKFFFFENRKLRTVGRMSMELTTIDLSEVGLIEEVDLFGPSFSSVAKEHDVSMAALTTPIRSHKEFIF